MMIEPASRSPWLRKLLVFIVIFLVVAGGIVYYLFTEKHEDTSSVKADFEISADSLLAQYNRNHEEANKLYTEKMLEVSGRVTAVEQPDSTVNVKFEDSVSGSYAIFSFQPQHAAEAAQVKPGDLVTVKGSCSGGVYSNILETVFVSFKRSALVK